MAKEKETKLHEKKEKVAGKMHPVDASMNKAMKKGMKYNEAGKYIAKQLSKGK